MYSIPFIRYFTHRVIAYNTEIPFEKKPALGFYDVSNEALDKEGINFKSLRQDQVRR